MSTGRPGSAGRRAGFTLIELLVVVAVIAILAALIMPVATKAISAGQSANCKSNLQQVGAAFATYVQRYTGMLPSHEDEPGQFGDVWGEKMYWRFAHGMLVQVMDEHKVFVCPVDTTAALELGARKWFSYTWNTRSGSFNYSTKVYRHRNISECKSPSTVIIFLDGVEGDGGTDGNDDRPYMPGGSTGSMRDGFTRHSGGLNALFLYRHVENFMLGETNDANYNW